MSEISNNKNIFVIDENNSSSKGATRKMAAIFAADVVGYSKLMASNEKLTLFRLKETRKITDKIISSLHGRIFSTAGDSIMAEFASPVDAMEAAISIQKEVTKNLDQIKDSITIEFRIGINLGDIMIQDNNLYGDNVNIAARLESISTPGEITISEKVYQEVHNKVDISFKSLGEKKLKNITQKIKVYESLMFQKNNQDKKISINFSKKYLIVIAVIIICIVTMIFYFNNKSSDNIQYTESSKSVLENFRTTENSDSNQTNLNQGKTVIAVMEFQNQSNNYGIENVKTLKSIIDRNLISNQSAVVATPQGSENLNPPEVMLIATESNASFVINGIIYTEDGNNFLNLKIYEAKRGSLIINQKIDLAPNNDSFNKFMQKFSNDIMKK
ncbi:MAG: hypothetical protein CMP40_02260 [Rickettsiales bacterium]|nr:hypothetical protein [Rickettsiales bacterium]|tara:strand:- start:106 stop:1263 length:1158 start_codon:yes stop_codon:yes gene_type:complete